MNKQELLHELKHYEMQETYTEERAMVFCNAMDFVIHLAEQLDESSEVAALKHKLAVVERALWSAVQSSDSLWSSGVTPESLYDEYVTQAAEELKEGELNE